MSNNNALIAKEDLSTLKCIVLTPGKSKNALFNGLIKFLSVSILTSRPNGWQFSQRLKDERLKEDVRRIPSKTYSLFIFIE